MIRLTLLALALVIAEPSFSLSIADAAEPQKKNQKKVQKKKDKSSGKGRDGYTAEERKRILENARRVCREKSGASSTVCSIDYKKMRVLCMPPGA